MDEIEQTLPKRLKVTFTLSVPVELNSKLEYIKKRTFLTKQQVVLMLCSKAIEEWCATLMAEEVALRSGAVVPKVDPRVHKVGGALGPDISRAATVFRAPQPPPLPPNPPSSVHKAIQRQSGGGVMMNNPKGDGYFNPPHYDPWTVPLGNKKEDK